VRRHHLTACLIGAVSVALTLTSLPAMAATTPSPDPAAATSSPTPEPAPPASTTPSPTQPPSAAPASGVVVRWDRAGARGAPRTASVSRGDTTTLAGTVTDADGVPVAGAPVALDRVDHDGRTVPAETAEGWTEVAETVTAADGSFRFGVRLTRSSAFRARSEQAVSGVYAVAARAGVRIALSTSLLRTVPEAPRRTITGTVTDADGARVAGLPITVERRLYRGDWARFTGTTTDADGAFRFLAASGSPKYIYYRVISAGTDAYEPTTSRMVSHEVRHDPFDAAQVQRIIRSAKASGLKVGVGLVDRKTGRTYNFGHQQSTFYTASVAKVMVAMDVLRDDQARGRTTPSSGNAGRIRGMIRNSNDAITWSYWRSRGGAAVVGRVNKRCGTSIKVYNNTWSMSRPSPVMMAKVLDCLADHRALNAGLSNFLMYQMRNVTPSQRWGVPAADPDRFRDEMNKNGWWRWPCCYFWTVNSTGLFGAGNRYAFTVLTEYGGSSPQSRGERQAYAATRAMFPWGTIIY
jgi:hypothetical protein